MWCKALSWEGNPPGELGVWLRGVKGVTELPPPHPDPAVAEVKGGGEFTGVVGLELLALWSVG